MITKEQIEKLSQDYQIDSFTLFREYLQLIFLKSLYQHKKADKIYFKGGTALHLLFNSPRFSEDLDFSTPYGRKEIKRIIKEVEQWLQREIPEAKILLLYQGKKSIRFRLKYQSSYFKYPLVIRVDFNEREKPKKILASPLVTPFPIIFFPIVAHLSEEEILAEKIRAFLFRGKGRDVFDIWFLLEKKVKFDKSLIVQKLKEARKKFSQEELIKKIKDFSQKKLELDLNKFLPQYQRKIIPILKSKLKTLLKVGIER